MVPLVMAKLAFIGQYTRFENLAYDDYQSQYDG